MTATPAQAESQALFDAPYKPPKTKLGRRLKCWLGFHWRLTHSETGQQLCGYCMKALGHYKENF